MTKKEYIAIYRQMYRIRACEESFVELIIDGTVKCPVHLSSGQEAVAVGLCGALAKKDYIFGGHRSHGHYLAKGGSLRKMVAEIYCKDSGCSRGRGGSMHLIDNDHGILGTVPIVAGTVSLALGSAYASMIKRDCRVTVCFFGDGATGEGVVWEAMNFAALKKLPLIFACENNLYSTHMPIRECRPDVDIEKAAVAFGIKRFRVDGNDVLKVRKVSEDMIAHSRAGKGPCFAEFLTYRLRGHVGPDDNVQGTRTDIRPKKEILRWQKRDPVESFEKLLLRKRCASESEIVKIKKAIHAEIVSAHQFAEASPFPARSEMSKYVFKK